ncbi:type IX secretion system membrane protein PorP/SprF [Fulvivirga sp. M361]|uniref:PorP/SprF family type IX secretion system membrane protein n=1 Tax=Fulvivirga sp. M361 TaxID=2594266 RepID=UPI00117A42D4|nr:type IX secretion system membrane protein PorP/SprF [Fulvivirga sp. M361]TRX61177.1 type IX secretion system membrane protein PorP/SprF [Fulvivirga sp. M361]
MLKRSIAALLLFLCLACLPSQAQDIPLFSQKLTNSFIYNPAVAGHTHGSLTLGHRKTFNDFARNNYFSFHTPFGDHKYGVGVNLFTERINFIENIYASGAFAYHLNFGRNSALSLGVSAELNRIQFDPGEINFEGGDQDPFFTNFSAENDIDFSFGLHYQHQYFKVGLAANRLATSFIKEEGSTVLSDFYSATVSGLIPFRGGQDILEPTFNFRKLSNASEIWDVGVYYTYSNMLLGGAAWREGDILSLTAGIKIAKRILIGYSHEIPNGDFDLGATNEITLRLDFSDKTYQDRFKQDYKSGLAFRRKTLSSAAKRGRSVGAKSPKALAKRRKKLKNLKSPNQRYNNTKKLSKVRSKKFNVQKRRRKNYKRSRKGRKPSPYKRRR